MKRVFCAVLAFVLLTCAACAEELIISRIQVQEIGSIFLPKDTTGDFLGRDERGWICAEGHNDAYRLNFYRMDSKSNANPPATLNLFSQLADVQAFLPEGVLYETDAYGVLSAEFVREDENAVPQRVHVSLIEGKNSYLILEFSQPADAENPLDFGMLSATAVMK